MHASELILNADGSIYHLHLLPEDIASTIITVGDQNRVAEVSKHFDSIEIKKSYREFTTHTGTLQGKRLTVISTGIGTDNVDIVLNELDALVNIDLNTRQIKTDFKRLTFVRIGTSGCLRAEIPVNAFLISRHAIGFDGLMYFYNNYNNFEHSLLKKSFEQYFNHIPFYIASANEELIEHFRSNHFFEGITLTCSGFYAPQMRQLRLAPRFSNFFEQSERFEFEGLHLANMEMETAGIYLLAEMLGHRAISLNALLANRKTGDFSTTPKEAVEQLIKQSLDRIVEL